jgi:protein-tyrosine kinase
MGKIFDAMQKAIATPAKQTGAQAKAPTAAPLVETDKNNRETVDSLRLKPPAGGSDVTERSFQLLPMNELLVTCRQDGGQDASFAAEQYKMLCSQIMFPGDRSVPRTVMVTSAIPGEGKSVVASNLAISIALGKNEHVLLIEADLRRPSLAKLFGLKNSRGLSDYLLEDDQLSHLLCQTRVDKLTLLPAGKLPRNPYELLSSERMKGLLEEVRNRYDDRYVILDSTPAQVAAETRVLSKFIDGIIMVVRYGKTSRKLIQQTVEKVGKEMFLGVVFNGLEDRDMYSYQHYYKYYGHTQKKRFGLFRRN